MAVRAVRPPATDQRTCGLKRKVETDRTEKYDVPDGGVHPARHHHDTPPRPPSKHKDGTHHKPRPLTRPRLRPPYAILGDNIS
jgi:hypothetical protein